MEDNLHYKRAQILIEQRRYAEAEKELLLALSQNPDAAEIYDDLSICRTEAKDYEKAIAYVEQAIALDPENPHYLYSYSRTLYLADRHAEAKQKIEQAIAIFPWSPEYFNLAGRLEFDNNNYQKALEYANLGLAADAENINCLNLRSSSLVKLNRKEEAFETIQEALYFDPENAFTHANLGWSTLEKGKAKDALIHFRNALKIDPTNNWAKSGMVEAMKGRYWIYNWFLQYTFWMNKHGKNFQWGFIVGFYVLSRVVRMLYPPLIILFLVLATLSWVIYPLSNLFLRINPYGRYALSKDDTLVSNFVGGGLLVFVAGLILFPFIGEDWTLALAFYGYSMMIPLASMLNPIRDRNKKILIAYTVALGATGLLAIVGLAANHPMGELLSIAYLLGLFLYQWTANYLIMR